PFVRKRKSRIHILLLLSRKKTGLPLRTTLPAHEGQIEIPCLNVSSSATWDKSIFLSFAIDVPVLLHLKRTGAYPASRMRRLGNKLHETEGKMRCFVRRGTRLGPLFRPDGRGPQDRSEGRGATLHQLRRGQRELKDRLPGAGVCADQARGRRVAIPCRPLL